MIRTTLSAFAALALLTTPALAFHCPQDAAAIEHALPLSTLGDAEKAEIEALKVEALALHEAGNHDEAQAMMADGMRRLLLAQ